MPRLNKKDLVARDKLIGRYGHSAVESAAPGLSTHLLETELTEEQLRRCRLVLVTGGKKNSRRGKYTTTDETFSLLWGRRASQDEYIAFKQVLGESFSEDSQDPFWALPVQKTAVGGNGGNEPPDPPEGDVYERDVRYYYGIDNDRPVVYPEPVEVVDSDEGPCQSKASPPPGGSGPGGGSANQGGPSVENHTWSAESGSDNNRPAEEPESVEGEISLIRHQVNGLELMQIEGSEEVLTTSEIVAQRLGYSGRKKVEVEELIHRNREFLKEFGELFR